MATEWTRTKLHENGRIVGEVSTRESAPGMFEWVVVVEGKPVVTGTGTAAEMNTAIMAAI